MPWLKQQDTDQRARLVGDLTIGRSSSCLLQLQDPRVSGHHALLRWTGSNWELRDLSSSNGTWVNGQRLSSTDRSTLLAGDKLSFGGPSSVWELNDSGPPVLAAHHEQRWQEAQRGLLSLPDQDSPEVVVYGDEQGRWVMERGSDSQVLSPPYKVTAGGREWTVHPPSQIAPTVNTGQAPLILEHLVVAFLVSQDEEHLEIELRGVGEPLRLPHRAQHYLLLTLARARTQDAELSPSERGWRYRDDLCRGLRIPDTQFNVALFRARQHLSRAGVLNAKGIVQRRRGSAQLRFGTERYVVEAL